jgi:hypothetical protein
MSNVGKFVKSIIDINLTYVGNILESTSELLKGSVGEASDGVDDIIDKVSKSFSSDNSCSCKYKGYNGDARDFSKELFNLQRSYRIKRHEIIRERDIVSIRHRKVLTDLHINGASDEEIEKENQSYFDQLDLYDAQLSEVTKEYKESLSKIKYEPKAPDEEEGEVDIDIDIEVTDEPKADEDQSE